MIPPTAEGITMQRAAWSQSDTSATLPLPLAGGAQVPEHGVPIT